MAKNKKKSISNKKSTSKKKSTSAKTSPKKKTKPPKIKKETAKYRKKRGFKPHNPKSMKGLKPWKKGESPNPGGMRKGTISLTRILQKLLLEDYPKSRKQKRSRAEALVRKMLDHSMSKRSDSAAPFVRMIFNRIEGKETDQSVKEQVRKELDGIMNDIETVIGSFIPDQEERTKFLKAIGFETIGEDEIGFDVDRKVTQVASDSSKEKSIRFYQSIVDDETNPLKDRLKAQERLDILHGHIAADKGKSPEELAAAVQGILQDIEKVGSPPNPEKSKSDTFSGSE